MLYRAIVDLKARGIQVHGYPDTEKVTRLLDGMAATGIDEAAAEPIGG